MYGIYANIWGILLVNIGKCGSIYGIHTDPMGMAWKQHHQVLGSFLGIYRKNCGNPWMKRSGLILTAFPADEAVIRRLTDFT